MKDFYKQNEAGESERKKRRENRKLKETETSIKNKITKRRD